MIKLVNLRKEYATVTPLKDVNVTINDGDIISVIGPSGTGKSTLIRCINMLEKPTSGHIYIDDEDITNPSCDITKIRKKVGMVFQSFNLFDNLTVIENVMRPAVDLLGMDKQAAYDRAMDLLQMVGMDDRQMDYPYMLSGGQKQRVAIARTLSMDPDVIMLDEPTSALDPTMVAEVEKVIKKLTSLGKTMIVVTHEMRFAREISNRIFYMDDGGIYMDGTPEEVFDNPKDDRVRKFLHLNNKLQITIDKEHMDFINNINDIMQFGIKEQISSKMIVRIQSAFEELCQQIILPSLDNPKDDRVRKFLHLNNKLQITIDNEHIDFINNINDIMQFGIKEQIPSKIIARIQSAFEELCQQIILPSLDDPKLLFTLEYRRHDGKAFVNVYYNGEAFDPRTSNNVLSLKLLENVTEEISYASTKQEDYTNHVTLTFIG